MIKKIKSYLLVAMMSLTLGAPVLVPATAAALTHSGCNDISDNIANGANQAANGTNAGPVGCDSSSVDSSSIGKIAQNVVKIFSILVGAVAIIMIIFGGFRYITSGGDSGKVGNAKNSLIYAIVGLVIVALAQLIVHFVLNQTTTITTQ